MSGTPILWTPISRICGMKAERFTAGSLFIERIQMREGPPVVYVCKSGASAMSFTDTKKLLAFIRWPKSTPTGQLIREWLASFTDQTELQAQLKSEAQAEPHQSQQESSASASESAQA